MNIVAGAQYIGGIQTLYDIQAAAAKFEKSTSRKIF